MALQPVMVSNFQMSEAHGQSTRDKEWKWVWNQEKKQGKWMHVSDMDSIPIPAKKERITMVTMNEESRRAADERAAQLRRENARRMKQKQAAARKAEEEEKERIRLALEQRKREKQESRSFITAGARNAARPSEVLFDDVAPPAALHADTGDGVIRRPGQISEKPSWNGGVGPSSTAVRVGYQPVSLVPPPTLPPRRKPPSSGSRTATGSTAPTMPASARSQCDAAVEEALARADERIARARIGSSGLAGRMAVGSGGSGQVTRHGGDSAMAMEKGRQWEHRPISPAGTESSAAPSSLAFFNDRAPCSANGGRYRARVDAVRGEIEELRRAVEGRPPSSGTFAGSVYGGSSRGGTANGRREVGTGESSRSGRRGQIPQSNGPAVKVEVAPESMLLYHRAASVHGGAKAPGRYGAAGRHAAANSAQQMWRQRAHVAVLQAPAAAGGEPEWTGRSRGGGRVRNELEAARAAAREQALCDSLDLDSPAHRPVFGGGRGELAGVGVEKRRHLLESLDLSASNSGLAGLPTAQQWLADAVKRAVATPADASTARAPEPAPIVRAGMGSKGREGTVAAGAGEWARRGPALLRRSGELLRKQGHEARQLVTRFRAEGDSRHPSNKMMAPMPPKASMAPSSSPSCPQPRLAAADAPERLATKGTKAETEVDEAEAALLASLARLDARLAEAADPAAAYVAAAEHVRRREEEAAPAKEIVHGPATQAPPLNHWNRRQDLEQHGEARLRGLPRIGAGGGAMARDRRASHRANK